MIRYTGYHPEVNKMLNTLEEVRVEAENRANLITGPGYYNETEEERTLRREKASATAGAYAFAQQVLMSARF